MRQVAYFSSLSALPPAASIFSLAELENACALTFNGTTQRASSQNLDGKSRLANKPGGFQLGRTHLPFEATGLDLSEVDNLVYTLKTLVGKPDLGKPAVQRHLSALEPQRGFRAVHPNGTAVLCDRGRRSCRCHYRHPCRGAWSLDEPLSAA